MTIYSQVATKHHLIRFYPGCLIPSGIIHVHLIINVLLESGPQDVRELIYETIKIFGPLKTFVVNFPSKSDWAKNLTCTLVILPTANCGPLVYDSSFPCFGKTLGINQLREGNFFTLAHGFRPLKGPTLLWLVLV